MSVKISSLSVELTLGFISVYRAACRAALLTFFFFAFPCPSSQNTRAAVGRLPRRLAAELYPPHVMCDYCVSDPAPGVGITDGRRLAKINSIKMDIVLK